MLKPFLSTGLRWWWVTILILAIDRYAKSWVMMHLTIGEPLRLLPIFNLTLAYNTGAAFSFLHTQSGWQNIMLGSLAVIVSIFILGWLYKMPARARGMNIALCFILGGALGNAWDRVMYAYVVDFLDVHWGEWHFAIFNVADSAICVGAFILMLHWLNESR